MCQRSVLQTKCPCLLLLVPKQPLSEMEMTELQAALTGLGRFDHLKNKTSPNRKHMKNDAT